MTKFNMVKEAVRDGYKVFCTNDNYQVIRDIKVNFFIKYNPNGDFVGLTDEYDPSDFFIK